MKTLALQNIIIGSQNIFAKQHKHNPTKYWKKKNLS